MLLHLIVYMCAADSTQGHWRFPRHGLEQGYAYLLTHPGTPCLFWDDLMEPRLQQSIRTLIGVRQRNGIHCRSEVRCWVLLDSSTGVVWQAFST